MYCVWLGKVFPRIVSAETILFWKLLIHLSPFSYSVARQIWLSSLNENPDSMAKKGFGNDPDCIKKKKPH